MISIGLWQPQVIDAEKWETWKMVIFHSFLYVYQRQHPGGTLTFRDLFGACFLFVIPRWNRLEK